MTSPPAPIADYIATAPDAAAEGLLALRQLILDEAAKLGLAPREDLRWGQPAFLTPKGASLRIGLPKSGGFALFVHCQTPLIADFRAATGDAFKTDGTRAILFDTLDDIEPGALAPLIRSALTYHDKKTA